MSECEAEEGAKALPSSFLLPSLLRRSNADGSIVVVCLYC